MDDGSIDSIVISEGSFFKIELNETVRIFSFEIRTVRSSPEDVKT